MVCWIVCFTRIFQISRKRYFIIFVGYFIKEYNLRLWNGHLKIDRLGIVEPFVCMSLVAFFGLKIHEVILYVICSSIFKYTCTTYILFYKLKCLTLTGEFEWVTIDINRGSNKISANINFLLIDLKICVVFCNTIFDLKAE